MNGCGNECEVVPFGALEVVHFLADFHRAGCLAQQSVVQVEAIGNCHSKSTGSEGLWNTEGKHNWEHDNTDCNHSANTICGREDCGYNNGQENDSQRRLVAAEFNRFLDDGATIGDSEGRMLITFFTTDDLVSQNYFHNA